MPCSGPLLCPVARSRSATAASCSAEGLIRRTALIPGPRALTAAIRLMYARVTCTLVTTQPSSGPDGQQRDAVTSFARGTLWGRAPGLAGDVQQYFSDRTSGPFAAPFDPARGERLGVQIALDPLSRLVTLELIAHAWGGARQTLTDLRVASGVLVGRGASIGNLTASALYAFSLGTIVVPV